MADFTTALDVVARAHFNEMKTNLKAQEPAWLPTWEDIPPAAQALYTDEFRVGIAALHEVGMLVDDAELVSRADSQRNPETADLTTAIEVVARAHFDDSKEQLDVQGPAWDEVPAAAKHRYKEQLLAGVAALNEAGLLRTQHNDLGDAA